MDARPEAQEERIARAFAPGHVTGLFAPAHRGADPRGRGSVGAGIVLEAGVRATARYRPSGPHRLRLEADRPGPFPISRETAERLFARRPGALSVSLVHELPIGQGFGMSAAGALATGLSVSAVLGIPRSRAIEIAHLADLFGGGGLGGVSAILGGGLEVRECPGVPPAGRIHHRPFRLPIVLSVVGRPMPSPRWLGDPSFLDAVREAAEPGLSRLGRDPSEATFLSASERFTDALGIAPPPLRRLIQVLRRSGSGVAQAMFGESLFAVPGSLAARTRLLRALERRGIRAVELSASRTGARLLSVTNRSSLERSPKGFNRRPARPPSR